MVRAATTGQEMKCPKCGRYSLQGSGEGVLCKVCGYRLSAGEVDKFRLFKMLREEERKSRQTQGGARRFRASARSTVGEAR